MTRQEMVDHFTAMGFTETQVINAIQTMANHSPIEIRPNGKARFSHKAKRNTMVYVANHLNSTFDLRLAKGITLSIRAIRK